MSYFVERIKQYFMESNKGKTISNIVKLDLIIKKAVSAIDKGKEQIHEIAESSYKECKRLELELQDLKIKTNEVIQKVELLERKLKNSRQKLMQVSKEFKGISDQMLRETYEEADNLRIELAVKREQEQNLISRRNELEIRLKEAYKTLERAETLISQIAVVMEYLSGDLIDISLQLEDIQQKRLFATKIIKAQEDERQRVARDIHDGPAQTMYNVVLKTELCEKLIEKDINKTKIELKNLKEIMSKCLHDTRRIIYDLRPMSLDDLGLIPTIENCITEHEKENNIKIEFNNNGIFEEINPAITVTIFRIIQEALNNIKKHAKAYNVTINLFIAQKALSLIIYDDGIGFKLDDLNNKSHGTNSGFGLISIKERVELLEGIYKIQSDIGRGTRISVQVPIE